MRKEFMNEVSQIYPETIIEALIFAAPEPVNDAKLAKIAGVHREEIPTFVESLNSSYERQGRSFRIRKIGGGYSIYVMHDFAPWIEELLGKDKDMHITRPMFEVLALISLKQPVTKPIIDKIRGVNSQAPLAHLIKSGLITISGRARTPGKPFLYNTSKKFLKIFGLNSSEDIPSFEELQKMFQNGLEST